MVDLQGGRLHQWKRLKGKRTGRGRGGNLAERTARPKGTCLAADAERPFVCACAGVRDGMGWERAEHPCISYSIHHVVFISSRGNPIKLTTKQSIQRRLFVCISLISATTDPNPSPQSHPDPSVGDSPTHSLTDSLKPLFALPKPVSQSLLSLLLSKSTLAYLLLARATQIPKKTLSFSVPLSPSTARGASLVSPPPPSLSFCLSTCLPTFYTLFSIAISITFYKKPHSLPRTKPRSETFCPLSPPLERLFKRTSQLVIYIF